MMKYLLDGEMSEYPHWRNYFDVVVAAATKPAFFQERRPLMERDGDELKPADVFPGARQDLRGRQTARSSSGASAPWATRCSTWEITSTATSCAARRSSAWRTAMIIQELEVEVLAHDSPPEDFARALHLEDGRDRPGGRASRLSDALQADLSRRIEHAHAAEWLQPWPDAEAERAGASSAPSIACAGACASWTPSFTTIERQRWTRRFHPFWGSLPLEENEESSLGSQVEEYACVYTSRVSTSEDSQQQIPGAPATRWRTSSAESMTMDDRGWPTSWGTARSQEGYVILEGEPGSRPARTRCRRGARAASRVTRPMGRNDLRGRASSQRVYSLASKGRRAPAAR